MALTPEEEQRRQRHKRIVRGLVVAGAAVGVPAAMNALVKRRAKRLPTASWGSGDRFVWAHGEIVYQSLGEGDPVVLLHSLGPGHSSAEWRRTAELLAQSYRVYAPDLLGWGQSEGSPPTFDGALYTQLLGDFLDQVVGQPAVVVAAGLSAPYAVQIAADRPEALRGLGLVAPSGGGLSRTPHDLKDTILHILLRLPILGTAALNVFTSRSAIASYLRREVYAAPAAVDDALIDEHYRSSHQPANQAALAAFLGGRLDHDVHQALARVEAPVWLAWGRHARSPAVETADLWLRQLEHGADLEVFERCGILPHAESPEELCRKLEQFLNRLGG